MTFYTGPRDWADQQRRNFETDAKVGQDTASEPDERCIVCGDPTGYRCCEYAKDRA